MSGQGRPAADAAKEPVCGSVSRWSVGSSAGSRRVCVCCEDVQAQMMSGVDRDGSDMQSMRLTRANAVGIREGKW